MSTASLLKSHPAGSRAGRLRVLAWWTVFPLVYLAANLAAVAAFDRGFGPAMTVAVISGITGIVLMVIELLLPHTRIWHKSQGDVGTDVAHVIFSTMLIPPVFEALFRSLLLVGAAWLTTQMGTAVWPHHWPLALQLALALVVAEFGQYWWHRMAHEKDMLWRFHATHHSSGRLYWLNSCRFHPVDSLTQYALEVTPLILLGCNAETLALFTLSTAVIGMFQHANIEIRLGALNWIFSMTELHRWHHSQNLQEANSNYGANLIVWDVVFGTRYLPKGRTLPARNVGLANMPNFPSDYWGQLLSPFRWRRLRDEAERIKPYEPAPTVHERTIQVPSHSDP